MTRAAFTPPPPQESRLPASLLERLGLEPSKAGSAATTAAAACRQAAVLLAPATTSSVMDAARFARVATEPQGPRRLAQKM
jgi:hypothetical protein